MSAALPDELSNALRASDRSAYFEQRIFVLSPFGFPATTALIFVLLIGTLAIALSISNVPILTQVHGRTAVEYIVLLGGWFCLMNTVVLAMQRYSRLKERADLPAFAQVLRGGWASAAQLTELTPVGAPLVFATLIGLALGIGLSWLFYVRGTDNLTGSPFLLVWFFFATTLIITLFTRGVALTRSANRGFRQTMDSELIIDLLRIDRLSVIGRSAARVALIWFTVSAVMFLAFIGGGVTLFTMALIFGACAIGAWVFLSTMEYVHLKIRAAKAAEMEVLRGEIETIRPRTGHESDAAQRLQGLLAFEKRIADAPEWPFDQPTLVRMFASPLILTVPWFGQAIAATLVEHLGHIPG
ncbi:MAG TPA: hypothetical protein VGU69_06550 [Rhizomicrobium sp.]|nr:hypothetical protein [Rhizomicrobium sp.]